MQERKIREAKEQKAYQLFEDGKQRYCEALGRNIMPEDGVNPLDKSHIISVKRCNEIGKPELAWDVNNLQQECRTKHQEWESYSPAVQHHKNLDVKVQYLKEHDLERYNKLMDKLEGLV